MHALKRIINDNEDFKKYTKRQREDIEKLESELNGLRYDMKRQKEEFQREQLERDQLYQLQKQEKPQLSVVQYLYVMKLIENEGRKDAIVERMMECVPLKNGQMGRAESLTDCDPEYLYQVAVGILREMNEKKSFDNAAQKADLVECREKLLVSERENDKLRRDVADLTKTLSRIRDERDNLRSSSDTFSSANEIISAYWKKVEDIRHSMTKTGFVTIENIIKANILKNILDKDCSNKITETIREVIRSDIFNPMRDTYNILQDKYIK